MGYLCANFGIPRPLCSRLRPDVRDRRRQTSDRRQTASLLNAPPKGGGITSDCIQPYSIGLVGSTLLSFYSFSISVKTNSQQFEHNVDFRIYLFFLLFLFVD